MAHTKKYDISRSSRKGNKIQSYICFWHGRYDGSRPSPACPVPPAPQPSNQHAKEDYKLISGMHRLDPTLGIMKLWAQIRKRGNPDVESLQGGEGRVGQQQLWGESLTSPNLMSRAAFQAAC